MKMHTLLAKKEEREKREERREKREKEMISHNNVNN